MQNGLGNEEEAAKLVPGASFLAGLCFLCSNHVAPGHIHHLDYGKVLLGPPAGVKHQHLPLLRADFDRAGIDNDMERDVPTSRWRKLCWNIPYNGLCSLYDCTTTHVMSTKHLLVEAEELMNEVVAGAAACGHALPADLPAEMIRLTEQMQPYFPSMVFDLRLGREPEFEYIFRRPLSAARASGQAMPRTAYLLDRLLKRCEAP